MLEERVVRRMTALIVVLASLALPMAVAAQAISEQKIEGAVLQTRVTLCQLRPRGCAGYMILDAARQGGRERVLVQVRLGVPITRDERDVALAVLAGSKVSVVYVAEKGGIVARSIKVLSMPASPPGR